MPREPNPTALSLKWPYCTHRGSILGPPGTVQHWALENTTTNFCLVLVSSHLGSELDHTAPDRLVPNRYLIGRYHCISCHLNPSPDIGTSNQDLSQTVLSPFLKPTPIAHQEKTDELHIQTDGHWTWRCLSLKMKQFWKPRGYKEERLTVRQACD